jgi:hypothetical protein
VALKSKNTRMNPFHAEIWDPGLLEDKEKSSHKVTKSKGPGSESDASTLSSDDEDYHKKSSKPPSGHRKISFSGFKKRYALLLNKELHLQNAKRRNLNQQDGIESFILVKRKCLILDQHLQLQDQKTMLGGNLTE